MNRLTPEQRLQIVQIYFEKHSSIRETFRGLRAFYGAHKRPSERLIRETVDRFRNTFTLIDNTHPVRRRTTPKQQAIDGQLNSTAMNLGDQFPNFKAATTIGPIDFYEWLGDSWGILFSHPSDYTPVCTTELSRVCTLLPEFQKRNVKPIALSCDNVESHRGWIEDIKSYGKCENFDYPIIADEKRNLAVKLNMLDKDEKDKEGIPLTCRAVFIIDNNKKLRLSILYPATTGRNFDEILRVIDSLQLTDKYKVATPVDWKAGGDCMVLPTISEKDAEILFPKGFKIETVPSGKAYIRKTPQPNL